MFKKIAIALLLICFSYQAYAQKSKTAIQTEIAINWADNVNNLITPALLRSPNQDIVNSYLDLNGAGSFNCGANLAITGFSNLSTPTCNPIASNVTIGTTVVNGGPGVLYNTTSGGTLAALLAVNSSVISFNASGVLQASATLPSGLSATNLNLTTPTLGVATATSIAIGGGGAITNSGSGGTLGSNAFTSTSYLPLAGGTMTGNIAMGNNLITGATSISSSTFTSTVPIGTAPFIITSTTNVPNLNASSLNGATFAAPGPIGSTTASTGAFTTLTSGQFTVTSNSGLAASFGANGQSNPVVSINASAASVANGWSFIGGAANNGAAMNVISSAVNETGGINAKGNAALTLNASGTGPVQISGGGGGVNLQSALTYGGVTFNNTVTGTGNLVGSASPTFTGTVSLAALTASGQITSTVSTGTAPFVVASTTNVANLNASTLSGATFASPGPIGSTTASTGAFTTLTASTSVASPSHYGGSAAGSTALFNGTSNGSPASAYLTLQSNGQFVSVGNTTPKTFFDVNQNTTAGSLIVSTSMMRLLQNDATLNGGFEMVGFNSNALSGNIMVGAIATGTAASPTATGTGGIGQYMFNMRGYGWNGSAWAVGAIQIMQNNGVWSGTNQATTIDYYTTPSNSVTVTLAMRLQSSGGLSVGTTTDGGIGTILANKGIGTVPTVVASLPTCNAGYEGQRAYVTDQNTAVSYRGAVTGSGSTRQAVLCSNSAWIQD